MKVLFWSLFLGTITTNLNCFTISMWSSLRFYLVIERIPQNIELFVIMPQDGKDNSHLVCTLFGFKCKSFPDVNILPGYLCLYLYICTISLSRNFPMHQNKGALENYIIMEWYIDLKAVPVASPALFCGKSHQITKNFVSRS